jgi:hypothetical protein
MAHCYRPKKDVKGMKRFLVKLQSGKEGIATISHKEKLETLKEVDSLIAGCNDRLELNETTLTSNKVSAVTYENTKKVEMRERERLETRRNIIKDLVYVGESIAFLRYLSPAT